jgi:hypothetical protein
MEELENRMERLEDAHRALAAQHTALLQVCRAMLPLIDAPETDIRKALLYAYDGMTAEMDRSNMDSTYQQDARAAIDALGASVVEAAGIRARNRRQT